MLWDRGYWAPEKGFENIGAALDKRELKFVMEGKRMHGSWVIVRLEGDGREVWSDRKPYIELDTVTALVAAAQTGALELHLWNCAPYLSEEPGRLVFDLDPAPDVAFEVFIASAREGRDRLDALGLVSFCKTTGGKGLHVITRIAAKGIDWPTAKAFARDVCKAMAAYALDRYLINMAKKERTGRIFLDYLRNDRMATAVAQLSPRGRPGAPVSMPVNWAQVKKGFDPAKYTVWTVPPLMERPRGPITTTANGRGRRRSSGSEKLDDL